MKKGQTVYLKRLKKEGIIQSVIRPGLYKVLVGILAVECSEKDLEPTPPSRGKKTRLLPRVSKKEKPVSKPRSIDLHGNTVEEAMVRVEKIVNDSILDNVEYLEIIHGVGTGKIRDAVHRYLSTLNVVSEYKQILSNPGITRVYF